MDNVLVCLAGLVVGAGVGVLLWSICAVGVAADDRQAQALAEMRKRDEARGRTPK